MAGNPLPEGVTEEDYEAIYAAVVETVRGRWFLDEFARRARRGEMDQVLAAIGRLESTILAQRPLPPPETAPHLRLFAQRVDEIASKLAQITEDLRLKGADERLCEDLSAQTRALAGFPKIATSEAASGPVEPAAPPLTAAAPVLQIEAQPLEIAEPQAEPSPVEAKAVEVPSDAAARELSDDELSDDEISALSEAEPEALFDEEGIPDEWEEEAQPEDLLLAGPSFEQAEPETSLPEDEPEVIAAEAKLPEPVDALQAADQEPAEFVALGEALETELADLEAEDLEAEDLPAEDLPTEDQPDLVPADLPDEPRLAALAAIDRLPLREKLALFG